MSSNLNRIDAFELSKRFVKTHFYSAMKEIYEVLEKKPFRYIDVYVFSDGLDTSPRKNDNLFQAITRRLHENTGSKCHFMNCGSASDGYRVAPWLGDPEADCPIGGSAHEIEAQITSSYREHHPALNSRRYTSNECSYSQKDMMTDEGIASLHKPRQKRPSVDDNDISGNFDISQFGKNQIEDNSTHGSVNSTQSSTIRVPTNQNASKIGFSPFFRMS
jgi:hypothetical protein